MESSEKPLRRTGSPSVGLVRANEVDAEALTEFLSRALSPAMASFLAEHADWWHRGTGPRYVAYCDGSIAGYRAMVPTVCYFEGRVISGVWAIHLYVAPEFRGLGLQRVLDQPVMEFPNLRMSFPSEMGAAIYRKQGYSIRSDVRMLRIPLDLGGVMRLRSSLGLRGAALRAGSAVLRPPAAGFRALFAQYHPKRTEAVDYCPLDLLFEIFQSQVRTDLVTTMRDKSYLTWRHMDAPYRSDLVFYLTGSPKPNLYAVVRYLSHGDAEKARVVDIFGDFFDAENLNDLFRTIVRDAARRGVAFVECMTTMPQIARASRRAGFLLEEQRLFRWMADDPDVQDRFANAQMHWVGGDGEKDFVI